MTTILLVLVCVIVGWVAWSLSKATTRNRYLEELIARLSRSEAQEAFEGAMDLAVAQMSEPMGSGISSAQAYEAIERATHCLNRINQIDGLPHGPASHPQKE